MNRFIKNPVTIYFEKKPIVTQVLWCVIGTLFYYLFILYTSYTFNKNHLSHLIFCVLIIIMLSYNIFLVILKFNFTWKYIVILPLVVYNSMLTYSFIRTFVNIIKYWNSSSSQVWF